MHVRRAARTAALVALLLGCKRTDETREKQEQNAVSPSATASASSNALGGEADEQVQPVYPLDAGPPSPLVEKLCAAIHDVPEKRRAECCKQQPGLVFTSECVRNLGAAVNAHTATLDATEVDRCVAAIESSHEGCGWVGPNRPAPPSECVNIVHGTLGEGARCRSSLECSEGLRCHGAGPTTAGTCGKPHATGGACGASSDVLVTYVAQRDDEKHQECTGICDRRKCVDLVARGGECTFSAMCGAGNACVDKKCVAVVEAKIGEACPTGDCVAGARCVNGVCISPKKDGEACSVDAECGGGCVKEKGKSSGVCGLRCDVR